MTIVAGPGTQLVPNGTTLPPNRVWTASGSVAGTFRAHFDSAQQESGFTGPDFDMNIVRAQTGVILLQRNCFWSETNITFTGSFPVGEICGFELQGGGEPKGTHQGTVFGFFLDVIPADDSFGQIDRQVLSDIERKLDRSPYQLVKLTAGVNSNRQINLEPGVRAIGWLFRQVPPTVDSTDGLPPYYFNLGFVTPLTTAGYVPSVRIKFQQQLLELPPAAQAVAFTIRPGLVIDVSQYTVPMNT